MADGIHKGSKWGIVHRVLEIFSDPEISQELAFRGGTALHKLVLPFAGRYSEDLDLVQIHAGPIGPVLNGIRNNLDHWLGEPAWKLNEDFTPETSRLRFKCIMPISSRYAALKTLAYP